MDSMIVRSASNGKRSTKVSTKRAAFFATYFHQQTWSFPDSVIYYITKYPSTSKCYQKMAQTCKYFFIKNSILVVPCLNLYYEDDVWYTSFNNKECFNLKVISSKIWITNKININNNDDIRDDKYIASFVIPKIYQNDAKESYIDQQIINFNDFHFLTSKCDFIWLGQTKIMYEKDTVAEMETFFQIIPKIKIFTFDFHIQDSNIITSKTVPELIKIPHFLNLDYFYLRFVPEVFDIDCFYNFIKKNKKTKIYLLFSDQISDEYSIRLQAIVNEIIADKNLDFKVPYFVFRGADLSSLKKMHELHNQN